MLASLPKPRRASILSDFYIAGKPEECRISSSRCRGGPELWVVLVLFKVTIPKTEPMIILVVDDDVEDLEFFGQAVQELDPEINCVEAYNGLEALKVLKRNSFLPDYIFLDINMPLMNGRKCLEEIRSNEVFRDIPVIIYSTTSDQSQIEEFRQLGAGFLTKPNSFGELLTALKKILQPETARK